MTHPWIAKQVRLAMARLFKSHTKIPASLANLTEKDQKSLIKMLLASHLCQALTQKMGLKPRPNASGTATPSKAAFVLSIL